MTWDTSDTSREEFDLSPAADAAITDVALLEGLTRDEAVNQAVQMFAFLTAERRLGNSLFIGRTWTLRIQSRWGQFFRLRFGVGTREVVWTYSGDPIER